MTELAIYIKKDKYYLPGLIWTMKALEDSDRWQHTQVFKNSDPGVYLFRYGREFSWGSRLDSHTEESSLKFLFLPFL